jgi:hypothetical protein
VERPRAKRMPPATSGSPAEIRAFFLHDRPHCGSCLALSGQRQRASGQ